MVYLGPDPQRPRQRFLRQLPGLPGLRYRRQIAEAKAMAAEALHGHIAAMRESGLAIPEPSTLGAVMQHPDYADSLALIPIEAPVTAAAA